MLGSRSEAEDAVQETWLRFASTSPDPANLRAWLTTVTGRICLDLLRSARVRRETYVGQWLPEPIVTRLPAGIDPADEVTEHEQVGLALLVVLERLTPEQRVAFVLHDVFAVPFDAIATALDTTPAAARQLATRARRTLADPGAPRHTADLAEQRRVMSAFMDAAQRGDLDGLARILAPDVVAIGDGNGLAPAAHKPVTGATQVSRFVLGLFRQVERYQSVRAEPVLVNGDIGLLIDAVDASGTPVLMVMVPTSADGRITALYNQLNPSKLVGVPRPDPATTAWPPRI
ncbi:sigma-70 family RNA polymerase sigma factor [Rugosimonospora acidiphila]|uniref:Sigma-70 family RNA polymerase sigma factor n=2 Tax=Rugosimonospora acidiphila TaxID=556531 RepID=A0ABP9RHZ6_9ACTN